MLTDRCQGDDCKRYRSDEVKLWKGKGRKAKPGSLVNRSKVDESKSWVDEADDQGKEVTGGQADEDRDDRKESLEEEVCHDRETKGYDRHAKGKDTVVARSIVHRHPHRRRSEGKTDNDDDTSDYHRRQGFIDPTVAALFDDERNDDVEESADERPSHRIRQSV